MLVAVGVGVGVAVLVGVGVNVAVAVAVGVALGVGVGVNVADGVGVGVNVAEGVGVVTGQPVPSVPNVSNVLGALWLLYSVVIQSAERATLETRTSSSEPFNGLALVPPPKAFRNTPKVRVSKLVALRLVVSGVPATPFR